jgi:hypothetical protein
LTVRGGRESRAPAPAVTNPPASTATVKSAPPA